MIDVEAMIAPTTTSEPKTKKKVYVTLTELCRQLSLDPARARMRLRRAKITKTMGLWSWPAGSHELAQVRDVLGK